MKPGSAPRETGWVAGIFRPGGSRAELWKLLEDGQRHTREECQARVGNRLDDALRSLIKNGPIHGASHRSRQKTHDWDIDNNSEGIQMRISVR